MIKKRTLPGGIERHIRELEIRTLLTDDPKRKAELRKQLAAARRCKAFLDKLPGAEFLNSGELHAQTHFSAPEKLRGD